MTNTIYILAGNDYEFKSFQKSLSDSNTEYKQIVDVSSLRGLYGEKVTCVGSYAERDDWPQIIDKFTVANFQFIELY